MEAAADSCNWCKSSGNMFISHLKDQLGAGHMGADCWTFHSWLTSMGIDTGVGPELGTDEGS